MIPHLITWCANRPDRKLLLVLLLRKEEYDRFGMFKISSRFKLVDIDGFACDQWEDLAWEYVWRNLTPPPASPGVDPVQELTDSPWSQDGQVAAGHLDYVEEGCAGLLRLARSHLRGMPWHGRKHFLTSPI